MYGISVLCSTRVVRLLNIRFKSNSSSKKLLEFLATMPKSNTARIVDAQRQRQTINKKSDKYGPSTVYLQVLGSGARGAPSTLYLFTDQKRYLFNCGESTQRLAHEHKVKLSKLEHIFITSKSWKNIGGLPGLSLTLQDVGVPSLTLHGPEGLEELYNATKRFVVMKDMEVNTVKCSPYEDFEDNAMSVKYILLGPNDEILQNIEPKGPTPKKQKLEDLVDKEFDKFIHDDTDYYKTNLKDDSKMIKKPKTAQTMKVLAEKAATDSLKKKTEKVLHDLQKKSHCTVAFICTLKKRLGTLDLAKCVEKGVKPGPMLGQLKSGQDVVLPDGTLILSKDVKTPDDPGPVFIVMEVPDLSYLRAKDFSAHFDDGSNPPENIPYLIVHYTPPDVFHHPSYREFVSQFGPETRHLLINSQNSCLGSEAVHRTQHKLHLLDSDIFPLLRDASLPAVWNSHPPPNNDSPTRRGLEDLKTKIALAQFQNIINMEGSKDETQVCDKEEGDGMKLETIAGRTLTVFHLRPKKQLDRSQEPKLHIQDYIQETMDVDGFVASLEQFQRQASNMRYKKGHVQNEYPKVIFLGTGSCIPSKTRNTSGIVLQVNENSSILMDCGEGTFGQLVRFFGPKKVNGFLRTLKAVYISHLHADHHIGLIGVLQARREALEQAGQAVDPVYLLAPGQIYTWLSLYDQQFERIKPDFQLVPNQNLTRQVDEMSGLEASTSDKDKELSPAVLANIGVHDIRTCYVSHCPNAFGVAITFNDDKITYSGDTVPCQNLVDLGKNSTLLIHEATMEDELVDEARIKMHSTTSQAIEIGERMNAKYTLLTHFSQRYARLPRLNPHILNGNKSVGIAFDNMQITMNDLELLPQMYAPLQLMFAEHCVEMEMKAANRARLKANRSSSPTLSDKGTKRNISPGCRTTSSNQMPPAKYRESNASRLRQEMKGMTVTGTVRPTPRSKSSTPDHRSPARSQQSEDLPDIELINIDILTPRTISETSYASHKTGSVKSFAGTCGHVLDTRSKTLNSVDAPKENKKEKQQTPINVARPSSATGYGKPLVTPVHAKLAVRRDWEDNTMVNGRVPPTSGNLTRTNITKPPAKLAKVDCKNLRTSKNPEPAENTRLLLILYDNNMYVYNAIANIVIWRVVHYVSYHYNIMWTWAVAFIAVGVLFWTATNETVSANVMLQGSIGGKQARAEDKAAVKRPAVKSQRPPLVKSLAQPAIRNRNLKPSTPLTDAKDSNPKPSPLKQIREQAKLGTFKTVGLEKLKSKEASLFSTGRPSSALHSTRSFKPQLEDIKSSFLLLNNKTHEANNNTGEATTTTEQGKENSSCQMTQPRSQPVTSSSLKPPVFDETRRKELLNMVKKKFQSRSFFNDARYEKIEGLNWIPWK